VLFLDEPTNGLDPAGREDMLHLVRELSTELGKSVVLSTHILQDVESVCDTVVVLDQGRVVANGPLRELTRAEENRFTIAVEPRDLMLPQQLDGGIRLRGEGGGVFVAWLAASDSPQRLFVAVAAAGGTVRSLLPHRRSLEEVFLQAVGNGAKGTHQP
jgi:ABC-2 type transport system ATP-binding protein